MMTAEQFWDGVGHCRWRFFPTDKYRPAGASPRSDGEWVKYEDALAYAAAQLAEKEREIERLKNKCDLMIRQDREEVWYWADDAEDHPESLACPALIQPDVVRRFVAAEQRLQEAQAENKQFSEILSKPDHYWLHEYRTQVAMVNVLRERLRQREAELEQRWIAVGERLPELKMRDSMCAAWNWKGSSEHVFVSSNFLSRRFDIGYLTEWDKGPQWATAHGQFMSHVTHWQPLPSPPKEAKS